MNSQNRSDSKAMSRIVDEIVEKEVAAAKAESVANTKRETALNMLKSTNLSPEKISQILNIDRNIVDELSKQVRQ